VNANTYECPLCGLDFEGAECHSSCPMSRGCAMVRCPQCGYEFVESGRITDMLKRWIRRAPKCAVQSDGTVSITELPVGTCAPVASIAPTSAARLNRLASYGIVPGSEVRLVSRRPAVVLQCGSASVALEDEIAREIYVVPAEAVS
jgi:Fe2+ transport system protein FeoA